MNLSDHSPREVSVKDMGWDSGFTKIALLLLGGLGMALSLCVVYWLLNTQAAFRTTTSPNHTYTVSLKGSSGRAHIMPNEIKVDVSKMGQPFASDIWLHSARNAFDLSFEAGFPQVRWLSDNLVEFYREQYFEKGSDSLTVRNSSTKAIRYIRLQSLNKFLLFDFEPMTSFSVEIPSSRGDFQWIAVEGVFSDGEILSFKHRSFDVRSSQGDHSNYQVDITSNGTLIEVAKH